jgi:hypothetical protein
MQSKPNKFGHTALTSPSSLLMRTQKTGGPAPFLQPTSLLLLVKSGLLVVRVMVKGLVH